MASKEQPSQYEIPPNSLSCYIGRICEEPSDSFASDGILWVDFYDLDGSKGGASHEEEGSTQRKAIASWTLRSAYIAWKNPPKILFKGSMKLKGKVVLPNANLSNVTLSGGPPLQGTVAHPMGPGTATVPVTISSASGTAKIEQPVNAELDVATDGDNLDIELVSQKAAQLPWAVSPDGASEGDELDEEEPFIHEGDKALVLAIGNSFDNLYVIDIFK